MIRLLLQVLGAWPGQQSRHPFISHLTPIRLFWEFYLFTPSKKYILLHIFYTYIYYIIYFFFLHVYFFHDEREHFFVVSLVKRWKLPTHSISLVQRFFTIVKVEPANQTSNRKSRIAVKSEPNGGSAKWPLKPPLTVRRRRDQLSKSAILPHSIYQKFSVSFILYYLKLFYFKVIDETFTHFYN